MELEVECTLSKGPARLSVRSGSSQLSVPLQAGPNRLVLPLLSQSAGPAPLQVSLLCTEPTKVRFTELRLVSALRGASARKLQVGEVIADEAGGRWTQTLELPTGVELPRFAAVAITTDKAGGEAADLSIQFHAAAASQDLTFDGLSAGGLIVLTPGELVGESLQRVVLSGSLPAPSAFVQGANLLEAVGR